MEFAVIETGGKQYKVSAGDMIQVEILAEAQKEGDKIVFDKVLLTEGASGTVVGTPFISGAKVTASLVGNARAQKVTIIKYKAKSNRFKKNGHRQPYAKVKIDSIK